MLKLIFSFAPAVLLAQNATMTIEDYKPKSTLVVPQHPVTRAKYPFIDVHNHQNSTMPVAELDKLVKDMDDINLQVMVNLSGGYGDRLEKGVANMKGHYKNRFVVFANIDFTNIDDPGYNQRAAAQLERDVRNGAQGLKIFKNFGMDLKDGKGQRIHVDDPRFDFLARRRCDNQFAHRCPLLVDLGRARAMAERHDAGGGEVERRPPRDAHETPHRSLEPTAEPRCEARQSRDGFVRLLRTRAGL